MWQNRLPAVSKVCQRINHIYFKGFGCRRSQQALAISVSDPIPRIGLSATVRKRKRMLAINSMLSSSRGPCRWILLVVCKACKLEVNCSTAMRLIRIYARFVFKLADWVFPPSCLHDCFTMLYLHRVFCRHLACGIEGVCQQPGISSLLFHSLGEKQTTSSAFLFCSLQLQQI